MGKPRTSESTRIFRGLPTAAGHWLPAAFVVSQSVSQSVRDD